MTRTEAINYHDELVATYTETGDDAILKEIAFLEVYLTETAPLSSGESELELIGAEDES